MANEEDDLFSTVKEAVEGLLGPDTPFIVIVPSRQQVATTLSPDEVPALLATSVVSMLNQKTIIREHVDEDGEEHKDTMN